MRLPLLCATALLTLPFLIAPASAGDSNLGRSLLGAASLRLGGEVFGLGTTSAGISPAGRAVVASDPRGRPPRAFLRSSLELPPTPLRSQRRTAPVGQDAVAPRSRRIGFPVNDTAGAFNPFFLPRLERVYVIRLPSAESALHGWTTMLASDEGYATRRAHSPEPIEQWISLVFTLPNEN